MESAKQGVGNATPPSLRQAMEVDQFVWSHPDFLIVTAAGDAGRTARDSTVGRFGPRLSCVNQV
jgi:hypothetical protein